ncbi:MULTISPECIES: DUF1353 domain-containing protein [unclassified Lentilitoribacter]|jgi:hypothetical protein|uniref:DUF1353 domain-containing protein n=1 Tax=unclassified Lentilitoribacter TaxID=2647570 RepID=UPI0013A6F432|nr:DUF1353 domain-containing protein [Lentilitoribacter sp. Alg239-R112]
MSRFTYFEDFDLVEDSHKLYRLNAPICWEVGAINSGWELTIPEGTVFDISVPWYLEWLQSPHDRAVLLAAAVHDELLKHGHDVAFASSEFRRAAISRGTSTWWAWILFWVTLWWTAVRKAMGKGYTDHSVR